MQNRPAASTEYLAARVVLLAARRAAGVRDALSENIKYVFSDEKPMPSTEALQFLIALKKPTLWKAKYDNENVHIFADDNLYWSNEFEQSRMSDDKQYLVNVKNDLEVRTDLMARVIDSWEDFLVPENALSHLFNSYIYDIKSPETVGFSMDAPSREDILAGANARLNVHYGSSSASIHVIHS
jgi:hypothetical protein